MRTRTLWAGTCKQTVADSQAFPCPTTVPPSAQGIPPPATVLLLGHPGHLPPASLPLLPASPRPVSPRLEMTPGRPWPSAQEGRGCMS